MIALGCLTRTMAGVSEMCKIVNLAKVRRGTCKNALL